MREIVEKSGDHHRSDSLLYYEGLPEETVSCQGSSTDAGFSRSLRIEFAASQDAPPEERLLKFIEDVTATVLSTTISYAWTILL